MDNDFVKIDSWHIVREQRPTRVPGRVVIITLCGRDTESTLVDLPPADEKTCEVCLRINLRRTES